MANHATVRSIKRAVQRWAYAYGYIIGSKEKLPTLALAARLREIFTNYAVDTVIDVGANEGQFAEFLRNDVGFTGKIESFEPIPALAQKLMVKAASDSNWTINQRALGAKLGNLSFNVTEISAFSSFRKPISVGVSETINVAVSTLDAEYFAKSDLRHTYLKLDTQGFDLEVLKGGKKCIRTIPALQTEVSFKPIYEKMPGYRESIAAFERYGFVLADLFLVAKDSNHAAMEFDALMIRPQIE